MLKAESMAMENVYLRILEMFMKENGTKTKKMEQDSLLILLSSKLNNKL